jgi:hypothetical protein
MIAVKKRRYTGGAAMIEAIFVISVFVLFFISMVYIRALYENKLRVMRLGRAGALVFAMNACQNQNDPLQPVRPDLGSATDNGNSGTQQGNANNAIKPSSSQPVGQKGGDIIGTTMQKSGFTGDPLSVIGLGSNSAASVQQGWTQRTIYQSKVSTVSTVSCGDKQEDGKLGDAIKYIASQFNL